MKGEARPWGEFIVLEETETYKVKVLTVRPGKRLSYQKHERRSERWVVVEGEATVVLDDIETSHTVGEVIFVEKGQKHRLANGTDKDVKIIEVQTGDYFGEDDIIRYDDDFGRI